MKPREIHEKWTMPNANPVACYLLLLLAAVLLVPAGDGPSPRPTAPHRPGTFNPGVRIDTSPADPDPYADTDADDGLARLLPPFAPAAPQWMPCWQFENVAHLNGCPMVLV
jgi:hypothetical protein